MPFTPLLNRYFSTKFTAGMCALMSMLFAGQVYAQSAAVISAETDIEAIKASDANVMMFYADWCSACKILDPQLVRAVETYEAAQINIVRLDYTRGDSEGLSKIADQALALGMADEVPAVAAKTGYALVIVDGQARGRLSAGMGVDIIHLVFDAALGNSDLQGAGL